MNAPDLCFLPASELSRLIRGRQISPVEVLEAILAQIGRLDGAINAYVTLTPDSARAAALEAEREIAAGGWRGPLHGVPVAVKDLLCTKGIRTTAGSRILADFVPAEDATVVARLKEAGAIVVGKTGLHEFAYGVTSHNPHHGDVHNPWDLDRVPGGSSGGSAAALAAGMATLALGSDTGGSIRIPAALCGLVGLKPTYGRVSRHGALPCAWSMDHVGPMARTAEDAALLLYVLAGYDPRDPASSREPVPDYAAELARGAAGLRAGVLREYATDPAEPAVDSAFQATLEVLRGLGVLVEEVSVPSLRSAVGASTVILSSEISAYHEGNLRTRPEDYGAEVRTRLELGLLLSAVDYVKAQRVRRLLIQQFRDLFRRHDLLLCPTTPATAPRLDQETIEVGGRIEPRGTALIRHTRLFNLTGLPAASVPCGFDSRGLPVGLQVAAALFGEGTVLRLAHAYQQATDWHLRRPAF